MLKLPFKCKLDQEITNKFYQRIESVIQKDITSERAGVKRQPVVDHWYN